jgi:hypothetical protein
MGDDMHTQEQVLLEQDEAAEILRWKPRTLERKRWEGSGPPYIKLGKKILYDREDVLAWARSHRRTSTSDNDAA